jgi:hypothetical protein
MRRSRFTLRAFASGSTATARRSPDASPGMAQPHCSTVSAEEDASWGASWRDVASFALLVCGMGSVF